MSNLFKQIFKEILAIYAGACIVLFFPDKILSFGPESSMNGWVETYVLMIIMSSLTIFFIDKDIELKQKIFGSLVVSILTIALEYLWYIYGAINLVLFGIIFGSPFLLIISKMIFKKMLKMPIFTRDTPRNENK